ncbi:TVP38/TMEM64 family protein [Clostridium sp. LBM24168]
MKILTSDKKVLGTIIISIVLIFMIIIAYEYYSRYIYIIRSPRKLKDIIVSYGKYGMFIFFILQVLQVIAFFIPGEFIQIASGYIYGTFFGTILSILGITLGSIIAYIISQIFGRPLMCKIISKRKFRFFRNILNSKNINFFVFFLYLVPGVPKDILAYICGMSEMNLREFTVYSTLGRLPGIMISSYFGAKIYSGNKFVLVFISLTMVLLFMIGFFRGEKIILKVAKHKSSK